MNIQVELTNKCNLSCVECPHRLMKRKHQNMRLAIFEAVLDQYVKVHNPGTVILHKDGEPLLYPFLKKAITLLADVSRCNIDIYTNGLLLKKKNVEFFGEFQNKFRVLVSFHKHNSDGSTNDYRPVTTELTDILRSCPENVEFVLASHVTDMAEKSELDAWQQSWQRIAKTTSCLSAVHVNSVINPWAGLIYQNNIVPFAGCPYADFGHLFIGVTGNVLACCVDLEEEIVFGNVMRDKPDDIMERLAAFYADLAKGHITRELCKRCLQ